MSCRLSELVIDCADPVALSRFWCEVLGYVELGREEPDDGVEIGQTGEEPWHSLQDPEGNEFCLLRRRLPEL